MNPVISALVSLLVGCVVWWLGVNLSGFLSAVPWPDFVLELSKQSKFQALFFWQLALQFSPVFIMATAAGFLLFGFVGRRRIYLLAAILPYFVFNWVLGSFQALYLNIGLAVVGLMLISLLALPLGVFVAWRLAHRVNSPASSTADMSA